MGVSDNVLFVGATDSQKRPNGNGALLLGDGTQHIGTFVRGRAEGPGFCLTPSGLILSGVWRQNLRVESFVVIDEKGRFWTETYNQQGKKVGRRSQIPTPAGFDALGSAEKCSTCGKLFNERFDHPYACRHHSGE